MLILLSDKYEHCHATTANLPTNKDAVQALLSHGVTASTSQSPLPTVQINSLCITMWVDTKTKYEWYVSYVKQMANNGSYIVDHIQRDEKTQNK